MFGALRSAINTVPVCSAASPPQTVRAQKNIMCIHGEVGGASNYDPISETEIAASGMDYIALGHIHKESGLKNAARPTMRGPAARRGAALTKLGEKHVYIVTLGNGCSVKPMCIAQRKYEILNVELKSGDVVSDVLAALPENTRSDVYRIVLRGEAAEPPQPDAIISAVGEIFLASGSRRNETQARRLGKRRRG